MQLTWHIRQANTQDADGLERCMHAAYAAYRDRLGDERLPPLDVDYLSEITDFPTWVVESQGTIVAGLIMSFDQSEASIANIAVHPGFQGQGIGGTLMRFAEEQARQRSISRLHLATHVQLSENLSLYRHLGWLETARSGTTVFLKKTI